MPSKIDLINRVLSEIGKLGVTTETDNDASQFIGQKLDELHPDLLKSYNWTWATVYRKDSTPLLDNYSPDFNYTYQLPPDYGQFYKFASSGADYPLYMFADGLLLANVKPIEYYYTMNFVNYEILPPLYARALVLYIASSVSLVLTNNIQLTGYLDQRFKEAKINALLHEDYQRSIREKPYNDFDRVTYV